ncbi:MAG: T9SS type A sorting domain-containing protein [Chitinophagaceae bacterium]|nr:T9SS type A sorting domain-containing protein [Chitinophagaceae bacterium]
MKKSTLLFLTFFAVFINLPFAFSQTPVWKDVAGIIYDNCTTCHRPGEIGADYLNATGYLSLVSSPFFYSIPTQIQARLMPPWKADPNYRHFLSERILSQSDIDKLTEWVNAEGPAGDTADAPDPPVFATGSQLGIPSATLTMSEPFTVPGDYSDHYQVFVLPANLFVDRDVSAIEFRPGNAKVVHHVFIYTCEDGSAAALDATTPEYGYESFGGAGEGVNADFLGLYAPGLQARFYPDGSGVKFKAGTDVLIQVHYAPVTEPTTDQSSINLFYSNETDLRKVKAKRVGEQYITEPVFFIPKNKVLTFHTEYPLDTTYSIFSIAPHQHLIGKDFKIWAVTPDGDSIPLIYLPKWDFNWQMLYSYPFMIKLEEGTTIYAAATYDNTANNPNNPNNPPVNIGYGESSFDEMFKYFMNLLPYMPGDEDIVLDSSWHPVGVAPVEGIVNTPQLYGPSPNPGTDEVWLTYYLPKSSPFALYVYDLSGRWVTTVKDEAITGAGMHRNALDVSKFENGTYLCTLVCDGKQVSKKFVVQH